MFNYSYKLLKLLELYADTVAILGYMLLLERPLQGIALQCSPGQALQPLPRIAYAAAVLLQAYHTDCKQTRLRRKLRPPLLYLAKYQ